MDRWEVKEYLKDKLPETKPPDVTDTSWERLLHYINFNDSLLKMSLNEGVSQTAYKNSVEAAVIRIGRRHWIRHYGEQSSYPRWLFFNHGAYKRALRQYGQEGAA